MRLFALLFLVSISNVAFAQKFLVLPDKNSAEQAWDEPAEKQFEEFVAKLGEAREKKLCFQLAQCLSLPEANLLYSPDDESLSFFADCADVPYLVRAYFAYKTNRPFAFTPLHPQNRIQRTSFSNFNSFASFARFVGDKIQTPVFKHASNAEGTDTYSVQVSRDFVKPGTLFYDPAGHVLIVYKVKLNGAVYMFDGQTTNYMTLKRTPETLYQPSQSEFGGGFRNWRPFQVKDKHELEFNPNAQLPGYNADEQYQSAFEVNGKRVNYWTWVRHRLSQTDTRTRPLEEFEIKVTQLCDDIAARAYAVQLATTARLDRRPHPAMLPDNIFFSEGDWETYSSPAMDAHLRRSMRALHRFVVRSLRQVANEENELIDYRGTTQELAESFLELWNRYHYSQDCLFVYSDSAEILRSISLSEVVNNAYDMSFDPYHCPELRWGQVPSAPCGDDVLKLDWYQKQTRLRNIIDRHGISKTPLDVGPQFREEINVGKLLNEIGKGLLPLPTSVKQVIETQVGQR